MTTANQYRRPAEKAFLESERADTTVLFGTLTPKHEALIRAVFRGAGYQCESLPTPTRRAHETGKEFCNNGLCNPTYFTSGALIEFLRERVRQGMSPAEVVRRYVYFTAGGCGPCRFGMYEGEYRDAVQIAGFPGFRILTFQSSRAIQDGSEHPGLNFTVNFGVGMFNALNLGDILFDLAYRIRPYEIHPGETNRVMAECLNDAATFLETRRHFELMEKLPHWVSRLLLRSEPVRNWSVAAAKVRHHLYGSDYLALLDRIRERLDSVEVDRTRVKPVVKITGEFFSAFTEGETNHNLFAALEAEGAEVWVESLVSLIQYWLHQAQLHNRNRRGLKKVREFWGREFLFGGSIGFWSWQYNRLRQAFGNLPHPLPPQAELSRVAAPWYHPLTRGGEGHIEVAKSLYYHWQRKAHLIVSVKPFGCMPSTQSDGVMAGVCARTPDLLFLPLETSAEGEVHALSRVQMALGDARRRAHSEFVGALEDSGGIELSRIRAYVAQHREVRRPFYGWSHKRDVAGTAADFATHISQRVRREDGR